MAECNHKVLVLCPTVAARVRCRHCHLSISREELGSGHCPECYAERGVKHDDFEELAVADPGKVRYRCEECALIIESDV